MITNYNTWITDLQVGDKVIEYYKPTGAILVSTVEYIDNDKILVRRSDNTVVKYGTDNAMIIYEYGTKIADFYLQQYEYPTEGTPYNPTKLSSMTKVDSIDYDGNYSGKYVDLTPKEGNYD